MAMRAARRRRKKIILWGPILGILLSVNVVVGCYFSGITVLRRVNLEGVRPSERFRLKRTLDSIRGIPALRIDPNVVEGAFLTQSRVKSADFRRNIFGTSHLRLKYREPLLKVSDAKFAFMDADGVIFNDPEVKGEYIRLKLEDKVRLTVAALAGLFDGAFLVQTTSEIQKRLVSGERPANSLEIEISEAGGVVLNMREGKVILGSHDNMPAKINELVQLLRTRPNLFELALELNLMVPDKPHIKLRKRTEPEQL